MMMGLSLEHYTPIMSQTQKASLIILYTTIHIWIQVHEHEYWILIERKRMINCTKYGNRGNNSNSKSQSSTWTVNSIRIRKGSSSLIPSVIFLVVLSRDFSGKYVQLELGTSWYKYPIPHSSPICSARRHGKHVISYHSSPSLWIEGMSVHCSDSEYGCVWKMQWKWKVEERWRSGE